MASKKVTPRGPSVVLDDVLPAHDRCQLEESPDVRAAREEELDAIAAEVYESHLHMEAINAANRKIRKFLHAKPLDAARAWQRQAGLFTYSGYETDAPGARWGVHAHVVIWIPDLRMEDTRHRWAPTWREAIAAAVQAVRNDEP